MTHLVQKNFKGNSNLVLESISQNVFKLPQFSACVKSLLSELDWATCKVVFLTLQTKIQTKVELKETSKELFLKLA